MRHVVKKIHGKLSMIDHPTRKQHHPWGTLYIKSKICTNEASMTAEPEASRSGALRASARSIIASSTQIPVDGEINGFQAFSGHEK